MIYDKVSKKAVDICDVTEIKTANELILLEESEAFATAQNIRLDSHLLADQNFHFLFFIGKDIVLEVQLEDVESAYGNPMVRYMELPEDYPLAKLEEFRSSAKNQREIANTICHIDVEKITRYVDKNLEQIIEPVWAQFMIYHLFNVPEIDYINEYENLAETFGRIRLCHPVNDSTTKISKSRDIKYDPDVYHFYAANTRQPLHTDYAYYRKDESPDWLMLYCIYPSEYGGITSMITTKTMDQILAKYKPELLEQIKTDVTYKYDGAEGVKIHDTYIYDGKFINWNYWQIKEELNSEEVMEIRENFFRFLEDIIVDGEIYDISKTWSPRDCVIFNDHLVLHGRSAFLGDRWLKDHAIYGDQTN